LEKNIKNQLENSKVMLQKVSKNSFERKNFCATGCFLKRNKGGNLFYILEASRGDGTK
jgi:hypothetical protein